MDRKKSFGRGRRRLNRKAFGEKALLTLLALLMLAPMIRAEAKGNYKAQVYPAFLLWQNPEKLPAKLSNGLVVDKASWDSDWKDAYLPVVKKDGKTIWTAKSQDPINPNGKVQFSVAANGDTVIFYQSGASGGSGANIAAIHANGKVFLRKDFVSDDTEVKLLGPTRIEVALERENPNWDPSTQPNAARHSNVYDVQVYDIGTDGKLKLIKSSVKK